VNQILAAFAPHLLDLGLTGLTGVLIWVATRAARLLGATNEQKARDALLDLVELVAGKARERLQQHLLSVTVPPDPEARASFLASVALPIVAGSAEYVAQQMPGKMRELGVDKAGIERMLSLRLGLTPTSPSEALTLVRRISETAAPAARAPHE
jgi:hypothetical protein